MPVLKKTGNAALFSFCVAGDRMNHSDGSVELMVISGGAILSGRQQRASHLAVSRTAESSQSAMPRNETTTFEKKKKGEPKRFPRRHSLPLNTVEITAV